MTIFDVLSLIGGLCLFLFGMNLMGEALERRAGNKLSALIGKLTNNRIAGFFTGLVVTAIIQSSSATTVMVVGFVNSRLMTLKQAIGVIMGANIGTTVTAWILSLGGIGDDNIVLQLLKPTSFTPLLALIGIVFYMFSKRNTRKDTGLILLGFSVLMFGMDAMSSAVSSLGDIPAFQQLFLAFKNPILGVIAGAVLTAIIQSSSASVGILQALTVTGQVSYGAAFPIIMGQNIGTCITAILSSFGTNRNAKRVAIAHLSFNVIGTAILLIILYVVKGLFAPAILDQEATYFGIAVSHSCFNVICTFILLPAASLLEKLVCKLVPDAKAKEEKTELDERLLATPAVALSTSRTYAVKMAHCSHEALSNSLYTLFDYKEALIEDIRLMEDETDHYEDVIGNYLVKLSSRKINEHESSQAAMLLHIIGDFERIGDHSVNICEAIEELNQKGISLTQKAKDELKVLCDAVSEVSQLALSAFEQNDLSCAQKILPLEDVIDTLKEKLRANHILRLQKGECTIEAGFVWSDLLTDLERVSDHCANIANCMLETSHDNLNMHQIERITKTESGEFKAYYKEYAEKYAIK